MNRPDHAGHGTTSIPARIGRERGPDGRYIGRHGARPAERTYRDRGVTPFVPTALRDIFDFGRILIHFFPPLPPKPLSPGGEWTDDAGLTIWRLADSASTRGPVARYRWIRRDSWEEGLGAGDSTIVVHRSETENGSLQWREGVGPIGWDGMTAAKVELTNGAGQSALRQEFRVRREPGACP